MNINRITEVIDFGDTLRTKENGMYQSHLKTDEDAMAQIDKWSAIEGNDIEFYVEPEVNPQIAINAQERAYLSNTDWYIIRFQETGEAIPQTILDGRANARKNVIE